MTNEGWIERQTKSPEARKTYEEERLILWATEAIARAMDQEDLAQAEVAERLDVSPSHVSQLLSGERNMTLRTLADLAFACGMRMDVALEPLRDGEYINYPVQMVGGAQPHEVELDESSQGETDRREGAVQADESSLAA